MGFLTWLFPDRERISWLAYNLERRRRALSRPTPQTHLDQPWLPQKQEQPSTARSADRLVQPSSISLPCLSSARNAAATETDSDL